VSPLNRRCNWYCWPSSKHPSHWWNPSWWVSCRCSWDWTGWDMWW